MITYQLYFQFACFSYLLVFCLEQLELLVAALIDFDAMDGKSSVSLLVECSSSPDVSTRYQLLFLRRI